MSIVELDPDRVLFDHAEVEEIIATLARELERVILERETAITRAEVAEARIPMWDAAGHEVPKVLDAMVTAEKQAFDDRVALALMTEELEVCQAMKAKITRVLTAERDAALAEVEELTAIVTAYQVGDSDQSLAGEAEWADVLAVRRINTGEVWVDHDGRLWGICQPGGGTLYQAPTLAEALAAYDERRVKLCPKTIAHGAHNCTLPLGHAGECDPELA